METSSLLEIIFFEIIVAVKGPAFWYIETNWVHSMKPQKLLRTQLPSSMAIPLTKKHSDLSSSISTALLRLRLSLFFFYGHNHVGLVCKVKPGVMYESNEIIQTAASSHEESTGC